ncbi:MAG: hypothetical protein O7H41_19700 [Planctomycetota bacterium]|nr:hypothetical protein [Planctomycetota bacterium]
MMKHISWLRWSILRAWGRSRLIRTSFAWLLLVPVLARLLLPIAGDHTVSLLGQSWDIHIGLPFHWVAFYAAAVLFASAQTLYLLSCPEMPDQFENVADFMAKHGRAVAFELGSQVARMANDIAAEARTWETTDLGADPETVKAAMLRISKGLKENPLYLAAVLIGKDKPLEGLIGGGITAETFANKLAVMAGGLDYMGMAGDRETIAQSEEFWVLYQFADQARPRRLLTCAILFGLGFLAFLIVVGQGALNVLSLAAQ